MLEEAAGRSPELLNTGVPQLDRVLGGGIPRGSVVMVLGAPGTGKTMLAQQISFHLAGRGDGTLYLTGYSETHDKLLLHTRGLSFFPEQFVGQQIQLISLPDLLEIGAAEAEQAIMTTAREQRAVLVVLDGFRTMRRYLADDLLIAHFLYSLGAKLTLLGATTLVTTEGDPDAPVRYPELTVCDIITGLYRERRGGSHRAARGRGPRGAGARRRSSVQHHPGRNYRPSPPGVRGHAGRTGAESSSGDLWHPGHRRAAGQRADDRVDHRRRR